LFSRKKTDSSKDSDKVNQNRSKLTEVNKRLTLQIELLLGKIQSLEVKTDELNKIIKELQSKKEQLEISLKNIEALQKEKEEVMAMAIHDIKNPAGTIQNLVNLLESYDLNAVEQTEIHKSLLTISNRIVKIVNTVSKSIKNTKNALKINFEKQNINDVLADVAERYTGVAESKSITVKLQTEESIPHIEFDFDKLDEAVENLLNNALKFSSKGALVTIKSKLEKDYVIIEVIDNGPGLSEEDVVMAFEKGSTLSAKPTSGETSTGLGLWIVKRIIDNHNGRVWVRSKKGEGSTFAFRIPIDQSQHTPKATDEF